MKISKCFWYYFFCTFCLLSISGVLTGQGWSSQHPTKEYYAFFRGYHFTNDHTKEQIDAKIECKSEECLSWAGTDLTPSQIEESKSSLLRLYAYKDYPRSRGQFIYPSYYHQLVQEYVNEYTQHKDNLSNKDSATRRILRKVGLETSKIFFISTSLNAYYALKYALGEVLSVNPELRLRQPVNSLVGFIDVFLIPRQELSDSHPFFVVEEFAKHNIDIPYQFHAKNYTNAEEVAFPFHLKQRYHKARIPIRTLEKQTPYYIKKRSTKIEALVEDFFKKNNLRRVRISPSSSSAISSLLPKEACEMRNQLNLLITDWGRSRFNSTCQTFEITENNLPSLTRRDDFIKLYALAALGRYGYSVSITFENVSLRSPLESLTIFCSMPDIGKIKMKGTQMQEIESHSAMTVAWFTKHSQTTTEKEAEEEIQYGFDQLAQHTHSSFQTFINALGKRRTPLILDLEGQIVDQKSREKLRSLKEVRYQDSQYDSARYNFVRAYRSGMLGEASSDDEEDFDNWEFSSEDSEHESYSDEEYFE